MNASKLQSPHCSKGKLEVQQSCPVHIGDNRGHQENPSKIEATFKSVIQSDISLNTIRQYIEHLKNAFVINEAVRYDVKGRKYIGTPVKYYFEDIGLRNARLGFRQVEETHLMENILYNELRMRGYQVDVGVVMKREKTEEGVMTKKQLEIMQKSKGGNRYGNEKKRQNVSGRRDRPVAKRSRVWCVCDDKRRRYSIWFADELCV